MTRIALPTTVRGALVASLCAVASAGAMAGDGKWVQDAKSCVAQL